MANIIYSVQSTNLHFYLILIEPCSIGTIIISTVQMGKPRWDLKK